MEIKQGDKVRVSEDAPELIFGSCDMSQIVCTVCCVDKDVAAINMINDERTEMKVWIVPTKYFVKVDAEAFRLANVISDAGLHQDNYLNEDKKEPKFKVGDKVVVHCPSGDSIGHILEIMLDGTYDIDYGGGCTGHNITRSQIEPYVAPKIKIGDRVRSKGYGLEAVVLGIDGEFIAVRRDDGIKQEWNISITELIEPTEQTEAEEDARIRQMEAELDEFRKVELDRILHPEKPTFEVTIDNVAMNWQRYEADLAKEVALKVANKHNDPKEAAEYAVLVAKAVVDGLKRK